jgi:hypothetical protein
MDKKIYGQSQFGKSSFEVMQPKLHIIKSTLLATVLTK